MSSHLWIETTYLHYESVGYGEKRIPGTTTGSTGTAGYLWVEDDNLHWIDENGDERWAIGTYVGYSLDLTLAGHLWVEGQYLHYWDETEYAFLPSPPYPPFTADYVTQERRLLGDPP